MRLLISIPLVVRNVKIVGPKGSVKVDLIFETGTSYSRDPVSHQACPESIEGKVLLPVRTYILGKFNNINGIIPLNSTNHLLVNNQSDSMPLMCTP